MCGSLKDQNKRYKSLGAGSTRNGQCFINYLSFLKKQQAPLIRISAGPNLGGAVGGKGNEQKGRASGMVKSSPNELDQAKWSFNENWEYLSEINNHDNNPIAKLYFSISQPCLNTNRQFMNRSTPIPLIYRNENNNCDMYYTTMHP